MNKLTYFASLLIIAIMLSGCRSEVLVKPSPALKKLKTVTTGYTDLTGDVISETKTFSYNSAGKLSGVILISSGFDSHIDSTTYIYSLDSVKAITVSTGHQSAQFNNYISTMLLKLNSKGYIASGVFFSTQSPGYFILTYDYDLTGYCKKATQVMGSDTLVANFKYIDGNMISCLENARWIGTDTVNLTYYQDKKNTIIPNNNSWFDYFGNENKNLMKTEHISASSLDFRYDYEFDANNYVTKRLTTVGANVSWDKYTYQ
jgi:hypothetical protein